MNRIRDELDALFFSILNSEARNLILDRLSVIKRDDNIKQVSDELYKLLKSNIGCAEITGREKTPIFNMEKKYNQKGYHLNNLLIL